MPRIYGNYTPRFETMEELDLIRRKSGDKKAYAKNKKQ